MKIINMKYWSFLFLLIPFSSTAQDSLMQILEQKTGYKVIATEAIFKGTRIINGHSVETRGRGVLDVLIGHRFGRINSGAYNFFGLDQSDIRIGADYGVTDRLNIGIGRSSFEKTYDGFIKYKWLKQQKGTAGIPVTVTAFSGIAIKTLKSDASELDFTSRLTYAFQLLVARKFSPGISFQLTPTLVHKNRVVSESIDHDTFAMGVGGRIKLTKRVSLNLEYFYRFNESPADIFYDAVAIGFDIETGGHIFQLHFTNTRSMIEKGFVTETEGDFFDGDIHFGFNISRTFQLY